jgi:cell division protein FtsQ
VEKGLNLWQLDTIAIQKRLATQPLVATARVKRQWPRTLVIDIEERVPAALMVQDGGFFLLDASGVIMEKMARIGHLNLPLISGLATQADLAPGQKIDAAGLKAALEVVQQIPASDLQRLQEINAGSPAGLELIWEGNILIKFGDHQNVSAKLARLRDTIGGLGAGRPVEYIDVSFEGPPVVKFSSY